MKKLFSIRTIILFFFALTACGLASAQQIITGTTSDGALYEFAVPGGWNGTLVVYAHGIIDPAAPIALPAVNDDFAPLRDALLSQGYAVASSSSSENGYAVADGVKQTHQLTGLFTAQVQRPTKTILIGKSLGGLVVAKLAERYPKQYDGALAMCGVVGGSTDEVKYLADARILFDYFFPGVMPGDTFHSPTLDFSPGSPAFNAVLQAVEIGFFDHRQPTIQLFLTAKLPASNPNEIVISILQTVGFNTRYGNDLLAHTQNRIPYDNQAVVYSGSFN